MQGLGASLSGLAAGIIVDHMGYSAAFLSFGAAACTALATLFIALPETAAPKQVNRANRILLPDG
jgi:sugar phosphate permease